MPGQNDLWPWLQSVMQNQGAANPNDPYKAPEGVHPWMMPGSGVNGMQATTPGAPSMGYPALGQPGPQPQPPQAPPPSQPVGPAGADGGFNNPYQAAANALFPGAAPGQGGIGSDARFAPSPAGQGGIGAYPDSTNYPHNMTPPTFNWPASSTPTGMPAPPADTTPAGSPSATPRPAGSGKGPLASSGGGGASMKRTPGAPNLGYYQQNPRFGTVQYQTPNSVGARAPIYTALNLGGGGQQPAVNPNAPAANAQPVSSGSPPAVQSQAPLNYGPLQQSNSLWDILSKAPWNYGPLQQGNIWRGSGGPRPAGG